jgi:Ras-related protein Rab-1A
MSKEMITFKILLLGDSSVGKTAFIVRFCDGKFEDDSLTTIGLDTKTKFVTHKEKKIQLQIWDTAGEERFRSIAKSCYKGADGILLMYDISKYETFKHIKSWITDIENNISVPKNKLALIIIGNKADLPNDQKIVDKKDVEEFENKFKYKIIEASAKIDKNVNESMIALIDKMLELGLGKVKQGLGEEDDTQKLSAKSKGKKKGFCGGGGKKTK